MLHASAFINICQFKWQCGHWQFVYTMCVILYYIGARSVTLLLMLLAVHAVDADA